MKNVLLLTVVLFSTIILRAKDNDGVKIKINENRLEKVYKVFFGSVTPREVTISIVDVRGKEIQSETVNGHGFEKHYSLNKLSNGLYTIVLKYDDEVYTHDIFLKSKREVWAERIVVKEESDKDKVHIHVAEFNEDPVSVFFLRKDGSWVVYDYWETKENDRDKTYMREKFDGASKIEITQNGEVVLSKSLAAN